MLKESLNDLLMLLVAFVCCAWERLTGRLVYSCDDMIVDLDDDCAPSL
jgi:hypothetical protein